MKELLFSSLFFSIALLCNSVVEAQSDTGRTNRGASIHPPLQNSAGVGVRTGFYAGEDTDSPTWFFGLSGRYRINPVIGLEASVDYQWLNRFTVPNGGSDAEEAEIRSIPVTASALLHVPISQRIMPYGIAGGGIYIAFQDFDELSIYDDNTSTEFGFHLGAGLEILIARNIALHGEWRHLFLDHVDEFNRQMLSGNAFTAGVTYYFR